MIALCAKYLNNESYYQSIKDSKKCKNNSNCGKCLLKFVPYLDLCTVLQCSVSLTVWSSNLEESGFPLFHGLYEKYNGVGEIGQSNLRTGGELSSLVIMQWAVTLPSSLFLSNGKWK